MSNNADPFADVNPIESGSDPFADVTPVVGADDDPFADVQPVSASEPKAPGIRESDVEDIARRHGANPEVLKTYVDIGGYLAEDAGPYAQARALIAAPVMGAVGNAPQLLYKLYHEQDDANRAALDELTDYLKERGSTRQMVSNIGGMMVGGAITGGAMHALNKAAGLGTLAGLGTQSALAAAEGLVSGAADAKSGERLAAAKEAATWGAGLAFGLGSLGAGARRAFKAWKRPAEELAETAEQYGPPKLVDEVEQAAAKANDSVEESAEAAYKANEGYEKMLQETMDFARRGEKSPLDDWKVFKKYAESRNVKLVDMPEKARPLLKKYAEDFVGPMSEKELRTLATMETMKGDIRRVAKRITGIKKGKQAVQEFYRRMQGYGSERYANVVAAMRRADYYADQMAMKGIKGTKDVSKGTQAFRFFADQTYVLREFEDATGLPFVSVSHSLSDASRAVTNSVAQVREHGNALFDVAKKLKIDDTKIVEMVENSTDPDYVAKLSTADKTVLGGWQMAWEKLRNAANDMGMDIPDEGLDYMKRQLKSNRELMISLLRKEATLPENFKPVRYVADYTAGKNIPKEIKEYFDGLGAVLRKPIQDVEDVAKARSKILNPFDEQPTKFMLQASPAQERIEKTMPDWVRETNPYQLLDSWANQIARAQYMHEPMVKLMGLRDAVKKAGFVTEARYIDNLLSDLTGVARKGDGTLAYATTKAVQKFKLKYAKLAEEADTPTKRAYYGTLAQMPDLLTWAQQQLYPYYMGLRVDNVVRNLTQPYTMSSALLGYKNVAAAQLDVLKDYKNIRQLLKDKNLISSYQKFEAIGWTQEGMLSIAGPTSKTRQWTDAASNVAMSMYTASDTINRAVTWKAAGRWAQEALGDPQKALDIINRLPPSYQNRALRALRAGDEGQLHDIMGRYSIATTQFNYDRVSMNAYGRYMGGMFSMFTKWPASIGGDVFYKIRKGENLLTDRESFMKYLGPMVAFGLAEGTLNALDWDDKALTKQIIGGQISTWAPASSLIPREGTAGELLSSPAADLTIKMGKNLQGMLTDPEKAPARLGSAALQGAAFFPGAVWLKFVFKELPDWQKALEGD